MSIHIDNKAVTKDGRKWYFKVYYKDQKGVLKPYKSKKYKTKKETQNAQALFKLKHSTYKNTQNIKFGVVANDYFEHSKNKNKTSTIYTYQEAYNKHIKTFFEDLNIFEIDIKFLQSWRKNIEKNKLSYSYKNKFHCILQNIFEHAIKFYDLDKNPEKILGPFEHTNDSVKKDTEKLRYITYENFQLFIECVDNIMWKTFFTFLYYTGCRRGEVQALTWNDIDVETSTIHIYKTLSVKTATAHYTITNTKNKQNRSIKMNKTLTEQLLEYKKEMMKFTDFKESWFVFGSTRFLAQTTIDNNKHKYFKLSGVKEITTHEFRHSHVSLLINEYIKTSERKNMKVDTAKFFLMMSDRMGHSIQVMQETYMHLFPSIQDEIVSLLDNL